MKKKSKNDLLNIFHVTAIFLLSLSYLFLYRYYGIIFKNNFKDGFLNAKAISDEKNCRLKEKYDKCIKNLIDNHNSKTNILFLGNSQLGAINNYQMGDKNYVTLLSNDSFFKEKQIIINSIWAPNASLKEFATITKGLMRCNFEPEILIIPAFLDDTRESTIRNYIKNFSYRFCSSNKEIPLSEKTYGNIKKLDKSIKNNFNFIKNIQSINTKFRTDLYKFRNFVFRIKPDTVRRIKVSSYSANINALEEIIESRNQKKFKNVIYIPPLLYSKSKNKIPYSIKEYSYFKKNIQDICKKYNCLFFNLEESVKDEFWGTKLSTNLSSSKGEIDFMHFTSNGHLKLKKEFQSIIKDNLIINF